MMVCETQPVSLGSTPLDAIPSEPQSAPSLEPNPLVKFAIEPGARVNMSEIEASYHGTYEAREQAIPEIRFYAHKLDQLQYSMYAEKKHSLLVILQGLDAGGKDGAARHIMTSMNPAGCRIINFKTPSRTELDHDFLWRAHAQVPAKGEVAIFNRSHYEDVLVVRVHRQIDAEACWNRYGLINDFERLLVSENRTTVLKFLLHISKEEQLARFKQRLDDPSRRWKISESDYKERQYWDQYIQAFEDMLRKTSTRHAPWYVIPSNNRWYRDLVISQIVVRTLENLGMRAPEPAVDVARLRCQYHAAEAAVPAT